MIRRSIRSSSKRCSPRPERRSRDGRSRSTTGRSALWRGDAYGEFGGEWWLLAEANRLNEMRVVAMEERAEALLALGHHHRVIPELERLARRSSVARAAGVAADAGVVRNGSSRRRTSRVSVVPRRGWPTRPVSIRRASWSRWNARWRRVDPSPTVSMRAPGCCAATSSTRCSARAHSAGSSRRRNRAPTARSPSRRSVRTLPTDPEFIQRFEAEAQLVARLEHPHIVPLYDYWREPGGAYLVFRLLARGHGVRLDGQRRTVQRVAGQPVGRGGRRRVARRAHGRRRALRHQAVERVVRRGRQRLPVGLRHRRHVGDVRSGRRPTRAYAAPELVDRSGDTVHSDIFSFGCMLWELLAGAVAVVGDAVRRSVRACRAWRARSPSHARRSTPCSPGRRRADPRSRYESMAELIVAWRDAVGRPEGVLTPIGSPRAVRRTIHHGAGPCAP